MRRDRGFDLRLFQGFRRGMPFHRPEPPKLRERNDSCGLPAEVDELVRLGRFRVSSASGTTAYAFMSMYDILDYMIEAHKPGSRN